MTSSHGDMNKKAPSALVVGALGVVFGDIGTSPLYAFKQSIEAAGGVSQENILAILSLMIWSLLLVVTLKYVLVIMRAAKVAHWRSRPLHWIASMAKPCAGSFYVRV